MEFLKPEEAVYAEDGGGDTHQQNQRQQTGPINKLECELKRDVI